MFSKSRDVFYILIVAISLIFSIDCSHKSFDSKENRLLTLLGEFPSPPPLEIDTLETTYLENGVRYKIEYTAEEEDTLFDRPSDRIRAYLFVPKNEKNIKLPAIIAVHQDGSKTHLGKKEPAGIEGDKNLYYGLDLFQRGYVVICPDRMRHAERRRIPNAESAGTDMMRDNTLVAHWCGQLILSGMTYYGKEVYDLMRAMDVLYSLDFVDKGRIGAIGHSGGGNILVYYMFVDKRVKVGVSSCGFFELLNHYNENAPKVPTLGFAIPGLAKIGKSADYLSYIAPRPFMMTRGLYEHGQNAEVQKYNEEHVNETKEIEKSARERYQRLNATDKLQAIYFQGGHDFPLAIREKAYRFIDKYLNY